MPTSCGDSPVLPPDHPGEFSRAVRYVDLCENGTALPETEVGPKALALFLGTPSRAGA